MIDILGYILALFVGFSLGLLGGGGSILTVPILVYVIGIEPVLATTYSLFIVGSTAAVGTFRKVKNKLVDFKAALFFGLPSLLSVLATRKYIMPAIPDVIFETDVFTLSKGIGIMLLFAVLMLLAAIRMIKGPAETQQSKPEKSLVGLMLYGIFVGFLTALVGAGGGFLIVPAMVLLLHLPIKRAVGTSLLIITTNSLIGFLGDMSIGLSVNWSFIISFAALSIVGVFLGVYATRFVEPGRLKKMFGWFVLIMALAILSSEIFS